MAAARDIAALNGCHNSAALFAQVSAVSETALLRKSVELPETACKLLLADYVVAVSLKCREAGSVCYVTAAAQLVELCVTCCMLSSAKCN